MEAQARELWNGPWRSSMAFEYFPITGSKGLPQMRFCQMPLTVSGDKRSAGSSEVASASDTI